MADLKAPKRILQSDSQNSLPVTTMEENPQLIDLLHNPSKAYDHFTELKEAVASSTAVHPNYLKVVPSMNNDKNVKSGEVKNTQAKKETSLNCNQAMQKIDQFYSLYASELDSIEYGKSLQNVQDTWTSGTNSQKEGLSSSGAQMDNLDPFKTQSTPTQLAESFDGYSKYSKANIEKKVAEFTTEDEKKNYVLNLLSEMAGVEGVVRSMRAEKYMAGAYDFGKDSKEEVRRNLAAWLIGTHATAESMAGELEKSKNAKNPNSVYHDAWLLLYAKSDRASVAWGAKSLYDALGDNWENLGRDERSIDKVIDMCKDIQKTQGRVMEDLAHQENVEINGWTLAFVSEHGQAIVDVGVAATSALLLQPELSMYYFGFRGAGMAVEGAAEGDWGKAFTGTMMAIPLVGRAGRVLAPSSKMMKWGTSVAGATSATAFTGMMAYDSTKLLYEASHTYFTLSDYVGIAQNAAFVAGIQMTEKMLTGTKKVMAQRKRAAAKQADKNDKTVKTKKPVQAYAEAKDAPETKSIYSAKDYMADPYSGARFRKLYSAVENVVPGIIEKDPGTALYLNIIAKSFSDRGVNALLSEMNKIKWLDGKRGKLKMASPEEQKDGLWKLLLDSEHLEDIQKRGGENPYPVDKLYSFPANMLDPIIWFGKKIGAAAKKTAKKMKKKAKQTAPVAEQPTQEKRVEISKLPYANEETAGIPKALQPDEVKKPFIGLKETKPLLRQAMLDNPNKDVKDMVNEHWADTEGLLNMMWNVWDRKMVDDYADYIRKCTTAGEVAEHGWALIEQFENRSRRTMIRTKTKTGVADGGENALAQLSDKRKVLFHHLKNDIDHPLVICELARGRLEKNGFSKEAQAIKEYEDKLRLISRGEGKAGGQMGATDYYKQMISSDATNGTLAANGQMVIDLSVEAEKVFGEAYQVLKKMNENGPTKGLLSGSLEDVEPRKIMDEHGAETKIPGWFERISKNRQEVINPSEMDIKTEDIGSLIKSRFADVTAPATKIYAEVDGDLLMQAFDNVLGNADKYKAAGTKVKVDVLERDGLIHIQVSNRVEAGGGITNEMWNRALRGESNDNATPNSTGVGILGSIAVIDGFDGRINLVDGGRESGTTTIEITVPSNEEAGGNLMNSGPTSGTSQSLSMQNALSDVGYTSAESQRLAQANMQRYLDDFYPGVKIEDVQFLDFGGVNDVYALRYKDETLGLIKGSSLVADKFMLDLYRRMGFDQGYSIMRYGNIDIMQFAEGTSLSACIRGGHIRSVRTGDDGKLIREDVPLDERIMSELAYEYGRQMAVHEAFSLHDPHGDNFRAVMIDGKAKIIRIDMEGATIGGMVSEDYVDAFSDTHAWTSPDGQYYAQLKAGFEAQAQLIYDNRAELIQRLGEVESELGSDKTLPHQIEGISQATIGTSFPTTIARLARTPQMAWESFLKEGKTGESNEYVQPDFDEEAYRYYQTMHPDWTHEQIMREMEEE